MILILSLIASVSFLLQVTGHQRGKIAHRSFYGLNILSLIFGVIQYYLLTMEPSWQFNATNVEISIAVNVFYFLIINCPTINSEVW